MLFKDHIEQKILMSLCYDIIINILISSVYLSFKTSTKSKVIYIQQSRSGSAFLLILLTRRVEGQRKLTRHIPSRVSSFLCL